MKLEWRLLHTERELERRERSRVGWNGRRAEIILRTRVFWMCIVGGTELFLFLTIEDVNDDGRRVDIVRDA